MAFLKRFEKIYAPLTAVCWRPLAAMASWRRPNAASSTACINASPMIWMRSYEPSAFPQARRVITQTRTKFSLGPL